MRLFGQAHTQDKENHLTAAIAPEENTALNKYVVRLVVFVTLTILLVWGVLSWYTAHMCYTFTGSCIVAGITLWSIPVMIVISVGILIALTSVGYYHRMQTAALINGFTKNVDYRKLSPDKQAEIMLQLAKSAATAEVDTYSPHIQGGKSNDEVMKMPDAAPVDAIAFSKLFNDGD